MLTDIEIAAQAKMKRITDVAAAMGIHPEELEPYGHYKAKLSDDLLTRLQDRPDGKLVLVTAVNPTPAGEGKTTVSIGLGQAMCKLGKNAVIALREPSLGPVFGIKGGAAGGGYSQVVPMEDINLHFTGDLHAITSANNLMCALLDNHIQQGNVLGIDPRRVQFNVDVEEEVLRAAINDQLQCAVLEQRKLRHHRILVPILLMCILIAQPQLDVPFLRKRTEVNATAHRASRAKHVLMADGEIKRTVSAHAESCHGTSLTACVGKIVFVDIFHQFR